MNNNIKMKRVSMDEFYSFIQQYPRKLECNVHTIAEPPLVTHNDFTLGNWPDSIVASCLMFTSYEDDTPTNFKIRKGY